MLFVVEKENKKDEGVERWFATFSIFDPQNGHIGEDQKIGPFEVTEAMFNAFDVGGKANIVPA